MPHCVNLPYVNVTTQELGTSTTDAVPQYKLGTKAEMSDGSVYRYVSWSAAGTKGLVYLIDDSTWALGAGLTTTNGGAADPNRVGVFNTTPAAPNFSGGSAYGWICTLPVSIVIDLAGECAANVPLYTTATSGILDDASTGTILVQGVKNATAAAVVTAGASTSCSGTVEMYVSV